MRCKGTRNDGKPCESPDHLVNEETGYCYAHGPGSAERMTELGRKGAKAKNEKDRRGGLDPRELGQLETHADALRWLYLIALGAATKKIAHQDATAATRAVSEWRKVRADQSTRELVDELKAELERKEAEIKKLRTASLRSVS